MTRNITCTAAALTVAFGSAIATVAASGPDVVVGGIPSAAVSHGNEDPSGTGDYISAFNIGTDSCNIGDQDLDWDPSTNQHPAIHQSMYRLKDNRFEQIGMGWIKHGFLALNTDVGLCGMTCTRNQAGQTLYVGCSDLYSASLNGNRTYLGPTWEINAHSGVFKDPVSAADGTGAIANRLQVHNYDLNPATNSGAVYFVHGHYVHPDDAAAGNGNNGASYRRATIFVGTGTPTCPLGRYCAALTGTTQQLQCAIRAWKDTDPSVVETDAQVPGEGLFILSAKVTDLGTGFFHYEYALQNLNSDRSGGSFSIPLPVGVLLENIGFHDVDYHDGDGVLCDGCTCLGGSNAGLPCDVHTECLGGRCTGGTRLNFDGTDWPATVEVGKINWATTPHDLNSNANAIRWSTLYNFRFDANVGPEDTTATLGLFKPGFPSEVTIPTTGPRAGLIDCNHNDIPDTCDVACGGIGCPPFPECGGSLDCAINANGDGNGVPDECEIVLHDCQPNGIPDACDIFSGRSEDCQLPNGNTVPDECEPDCDGDGIPDTCETDTDCDGDGVTDCFDLCPCTTPVNACLPPYNQLVICCFPSGIYSNQFTWNQCIGFGALPVCDDPPMCPGTPCPESSCRDGCLVGDFDRDGDLDLFDVGVLQICYSGSIGSPAFVAPSTECMLRFDFDSDRDVDHGDYKEFLAAYTGP